MTTKAKRLHRLAFLHGQMKLLLDTRLAAQRTRLQELDRIKSGIMEALDQTTTLGTISYGASARRLAEIGICRATTERNLSDLRQKLIDVGNRQHILERQAVILSRTCERKVMESEAREIALQMKATGKHHVME